MPICRASSPVVSAAGEEEEACVEAVAPVEEGGSVTVPKETAAAGREALVCERELRPQPVSIRHNNINTMRRKNKRPLITTYTPG